jgi:hypothetical protein
MGMQNIDVLFDFTRREIGLHSSTEVESLTP